MLSDQFSNMCKPLRTFTPTFRVTMQQGAIWKQKTIFVASELCVVPRVWLAFICTRAVHRRKSVLRGRSEQLYSRRTEPRLMWVKQKWVTAKLKALTVTSESLIHTCFRSRSGEINSQLIIHALWISVIHIINITCTHVVMLGFLEEKRLVRLTTFSFNRIVSLEIFATQTNCIDQSCQA